MTQQVRKGYRNHRKGTWAAVLVVFVAAALAIAIPAVAINTNSCTDLLSEPGCIPPASKTASVYPSQAPVGGSNFACTGLDGSGRSYVRFQISKPDPAGSYPTGAPAGTYTDPTTGTTFVISKPADPKNAGKFFSWAVTGARVYHVGVNGGTQTAWYDYFLNPSTTSGYVSLDTELHATRQSLTKYYVASITTFCYLPVTYKVDGYVYRDKSGNGVTADDSALANRQVRLSTGATINTDTNGYYSFTVPEGSNFTVCAPSSTGELQTAPTGTACSGAGGYPFTNISADSPARNFAFVGGITASCSSDGSGTAFDSQYDSGKASVKAKFTYYGESCKAAGKQFVFTTYEDSSGSTRTAKLSPISSLGSTVCVLSTGANCQVVAQKITWALTGSSPELKTLSYDDTAEGGFSRPAMKFCLKDPIDRSKADGVTLLYGSDYLPDDILPSDESTCLVRTTQYGPPGAATRIDEVYSAYDGKINLT